MTQTPTLLERECRRALIAAELHDPRLARRFARLALQRGTSALVIQDRQAGTLEWDRFRPAFDLPGAQRRHAALSELNPALPWAVETARAAQPTWQRRRTVAGPQPTQVGQVLSAALPLLIAASVLCAALIAWAARL